METTAPQATAPVTSPAAAPAAAAPATAPAGGMKYAGFWIRFLAMVIDFIVLAILGSFVGATTFHDGTLNVSWEGWKVIIPIGYVLGLWIWKGATVGKMVLGLKIIQEDGSALTWQKALIRYISYIPSAIAIGLGFIWVAFDAKKQGWHDKIAKTYVIKSK